MLKLKNLFQTNFTLYFDAEKRSKEKRKKLMPASPPGLIVEEVEKFNVSLSWKKFARIGTLGMPPINKKSASVRTCDTDVDTGVGTLDNILYVKGRQLSIEEDI